MMCEKKHALSPGSIIHAPFHARVLSLLCVSVWPIEASAMPFDMHFV